MSDSQPTLDRYRRSVSIPRRLMPSLLAIHAGRTPSHTAVAEFRKGGIMAAEALDPLVDTLIGVITDPELVVTVEIDRFDTTMAPELATLWRRGETAVLGRADRRGRFDLIEVDTRLLPFHLAQIVRLVPRSQPAFAGSFSLPPSTLTRVEALATIDPRGAVAELGASGVAAVWVDRFLATLIMRRSMWAVESIWLGDRRRRDQARLSVLDGGYAGYWRLNHHNDRVVVIPTGFDDLMTRFSALLP